MTDIEGTFHEGGYEASAEYPVLPSGGEAWTEKRFSEEYEKS